MYRRGLRKHEALLRAGSSRETRHAQVCGTRHSMNKHREGLGERKVLNEDTRSEGVDESR